MTSHLEDHVIPASRQREKARGNLKWIGQDMKRVEDPRLLTGKGKYIDDIDLPNMAHAAVLGSSASFLGSCRENELVAAHPLVSQPQSVQLKNAFV